MEQDQALNIPTTQPQRRNTRSQQPKHHKKPMNEGEMETIQPLPPRRSTKAQGKRPVDPRAISRSRSDIARGKRPAIPNLRDEDSGDESDEETQAPSKIIKGVKGRSNRNLLSIFMDMTFLGTRYPHKETMKTLSIEADVKYLMDKCNLGTFFTYNMEAYKEETCHFLASLEVHLFEEADSDSSSDDVGYITFEIRGLPFTLSFAEIDRLYGFKSGPDSCQDFEKEELAEVWQIITGKKGFSSSRSKSSHIRNPAIRYLHKAIANTFFARRTTGNVNDGEIRFLDMALKDLLNQNVEGSHFEGDASETGLTVVMMYQLLYYKEWATRGQTKGTRSELCIGGIVMPILHACGVEITSWPVAPRFMDITYLTKANYLDRESVDGFVHLYRFDHPTEGMSRIVLPAPRLTGMRQGNNIDFNPPAESLYIPPAQEEGANQTHRPTYPEPRPQTMVPHPELEAQTQRIGMLEKLTKWQTKTIKALKNTVNEMKGQIKELQSIVSCSSKRHEAQGPVMMERSRSSSAAHMQQPYMEPPRVSATQFYQRKRRAVRSPVSSTSFRDQDIAQHQEHEAHATSLRDHNVAPSPEHRDATVSLDHDVAWEAPECPEPISTIPPSEDSAPGTEELWTTQDPYAEYTPYMANSGSTVPINYEDNQGMGQADYTKETMDDTTSSFSSRP